MERTNVLDDLTFDYHELSQVHVNERQKHHDAVKHDPKVDVGMSLVVLPFKGA